MENLHEWSLKMQGAREMLCAIIDHNHKFLLDNAGKESHVDHNAIVKLILSSKDNTHKFLAGMPIAYRFHKYDKKGKLLSCEAYFLD